MTHKARVLALLSDGCFHSYREGYALNVMLHSRVADLRKDGHVIECAKRDGGYWYRLLSRPGPQGSQQDERHEAHGAVTGASMDASTAPRSAPTVRGESWLDAQGPGRTSGAIEAPAPTLFDMPTEPLWA